MWKPVWFLVLTMLQPLSGQLGPLGCGKGRMYDPEILSQAGYYPFTAANLPPAFRTWTNPQNICDIFGAYTYNQMGNQGNVTDYLQGTAFGFSIPAGVKIVGLLVETRIWAGFTNITTFQLCNSVGLIGQPKDFSAPPGGFAWYNLGANNDTWGVHLTPILVNSEGFGAVCKVLQTEPNMLNYEIDVIQMTVYYKSRHKR
jgi:hypothetical protein